MSISEYYSKLDALWKEFDGLFNLNECTCEASAQFINHSKLMKIMHFLSGLDDTFSQVNSHILLTKPLPSVKTAFATISRQESQQKGGSISQTSTKS